MFLRDIEDEEIVSSKRMGLCDTRGKLNKYNRVQLKSVIAHKKQLRDLHTQCKSDRYFFYRSRTEQLRTLVWIDIFTFGQSVEQDTVSYHRDGRGDGKRVSKKGLRCIC